MTTKTAVVGSLGALALLDVGWALTSGRASPLVAAVGFAVVALLVGIRNEFRAGFVVGIVGVAIHAFELVFHGLRGLGVVEGVLFAANLCFSAIVAVCSWFGIQKLRAVRAAGENGGTRRLPN
jgi:hypothetical protein